MPYAALAIALSLGTLSGRVLDTTTGQPLPHVTVRAGNAHGVTDARGRFALRGVRLGDVPVTLESNDVPLQHVTVHLGARAASHDLRACSTTLDYHCGGAPSAPGAAGGAG